MSDAKDAFGFGQFVPGFDFLKGLSQGAASSMPGVPPGFAHWVAPTLDVEELDKRIEELKAVQFWLEQNGNALKATIQALEVQKMTLATLKGMNFHVADLAEAFKIKPTAGAAPFADVAGNMVEEAMKMQTPPPAAAAARNFASSFAPPAQPPAPAPAAAPAAAPASSRSAAKKRKPAATGAKPGAVPPESASASGVVDPMQWWGALTQQFQQIASQALADAAARAPSGAPSQTRSASKPPAASAASTSPAPRPAKKKAPARKAAARRSSRP